MAIAPRADAENATHVDVRMWGKRVGRLTRDADGAIAFEYDDGFRTSGLEISPLHLPLSSRGPLRFPELAQTAAFQGLPGVIADMLPDRFGTAAIRHVLAQQKQEALAADPLARLRFVAHRAIGALEVDTTTDRGTDDDDSFYAADLMDESRSVVQSITNDRIPLIARTGTSAGGMRPKAIVLWKPGADTFRAGDATPRDGEEQWIIKLDGVRPVGADIQATNTSNHLPQPYMRIEYAYSEMARIAGLALPETHLLIDRDYAHFLVKRFDRVNGKRLHQHTLGGMLHADYDVPGAVSYEDYMRTIAALGMPVTSKEEAFRRIVFNFMAVNQDDHIKNLSFLMDETGRWALSPAYDVTYARGHGWTRTHQMSLRGKRERVSRADLLAFGGEFGIGDAAHIVDCVAGAVARWVEFAAAARVPDEWIGRVRSDMLVCGV